MVGVRRVPEHAHRQAAKTLPRLGAHSEHAVDAGERGGLVAWQPPHRQDEDLVPLTAGACSPRRMSSRRIPRQTSGPDSNPHDGRGAASRRHRAPPEPDPTPLPDGRPLGSLGEAALSCRCIDSQPTWVAAGRASTSGPGVGASIEPSSDWTTATAVAVNAQYGQPCPTGWWATSVGRRDGVGGAQRLWPRSTSAHWRGQDRRASGCSGWFAATRAGYSASARQQAGLM
jgi:hypothetical protein